MSSYAKCVCALYIRQIVRVYSNISLSIYLCAISTVFTLDVYVCAYVDSVPVLEDIQLALLTSLQPPPFFKKKKKVAGC